jgi:hypothetical protein
MNVEIVTEDAQFPEKEHRNGIFVAVQTSYPFVVQFTKTTFVLILTHPSSMMRRAGYQGMMGISVGGGGWGGDLKMGICDCMRVGGGGVDKWQQKSQHKGGMSWGNSPSLLYTQRWGFLEGGGGYRHTDTGYRHRDTE